MVEARSAALWGHQATDVDRGACLTVTGGGSLSCVGETSPKVALFTPIDRGPARAPDAKPVLLHERGTSHAHDGGQLPRLC